MFRHIGTCSKEKIYDGRNQAIIHEKNTEKYSLN
jgi:hypothetical protein